MSKVSFLGAGSWGTALAIMLANNGHEVTLWSAVESEVEMLQVILKVPVRDSIL